MNDTEAIELLKAMVRIRSLSGEEGRLASFLVEKMRSIGFEAKVDEAGNAIGSVGTGSPTIILLGHMDTVPGDIPVRVEGGRLYGRGTVDAKGPLAAFIAAAARLRLSNNAQLPRIVVIGCVEEEAPSSRGARHVVTRYRPDLCIVGEPSGWESMTLGYKGFLRARLRLEQDAGHSAHARPLVAERACRVWMRISEGAQFFNGTRERLFDQVLPALVRIESGTDGRIDWAELQVNLRLPPGLPPESARVLLSEWATECDINVLGELPAWASGRTSLLHRAVARAIRRQGGEVRYLHKTGTADLNIVAPAWNCPALAYGPGDAALDHTPNEYIGLDEYLRGIRVLEDALRYCSEKFAPEGNDSSPAFSSSARVLR
jgi:LysW-gamma-L-lysine carboxypeptidase